MVDMRIFALLVSFTPALSLIVGSLGIYKFWGDAVFIAECVVFMFAGFNLSPWLPRIISWLYGKEFKKITSELPAADWIAVEMERLNTEHKLHIIPDDYGIMFKRNDMVHLVSHKGISMEYKKNDLCAQKTSDSTLSCSTRLLEQNTDFPCFNYAITPWYKGNDKDILANANHKFEWFKIWLKNQQ